MSRKTFSTVRRTTPVRHTARPAASRRVAQPDVAGGFLGLLSRLSSASERLEHARSRARRG